MEIAQTMKIRCTYNPDLSPLAIYVKEMKPALQRDTPIFWLYSQKLRFVFRLDAINT